MENLKFDIKGAQKALHTCVDEMYPMEKGIFIARPDEIVLQLGDNRITRRQIKQVIEQRKADNKSLEEVEEILLRIPAAVTEPDFQILNPNQRDLITAYQYRPIDAYLLLLKKFNTSTAGKTPGP